MDFCLFPSPAQLPCLHWDSRTQSLSHLGLHGLCCPLWGCLTDLLQQVVHLETQRLNLLVPSWQGFTSWKEKKKQPILNKLSAIPLPCQLQPFLLSLPSPNSQRKPSLQWHQDHFYTQRLQLLCLAFYKPSSCTEADSNREVPGEPRGSQKETDGIISCFPVVKRMQSMEWVKC